MQVLCKNRGCKKTHVIIPDFLNPHKRYVGAEIEASIEQAPLVVTHAEESTIRRWKKQFTEKLEDILNVLIRLLVTEYANMTSLLDCSSGLNRLRSVLKLFPFKISATTLGRANMELYGGSRILYF